MRRAEDLLLDWFGSVLAGKGGRPVQAIETFARQMGPGDGKCEVLIARRATSPLFAAMVNAASSHYAEQDDVHNGSVFHPAAVVFPAALAVAQSIGASGREFLAAAVAGYEVGIRIGEFLGRSHYRLFHTTGTAGTVAAAAAAGRLLKLTPEQMLHAFGSAGTQAAGLWEFLRDAADSKQLHTAKAAGDGLMSAYLAADGFTGARRILEGKQGMAAGMSSDADPSRLTDRLGQRWALAETSFKFHSSCRHTHPAADALLQVLTRRKLRADQVASVTAHVHQGAIDVLGPVVNPQTVHQAKFSMGTVLGLIAQFRAAGLKEFDSAYNDPRVAAFRQKVAMQLDDEVDNAYPARWIGKVTVVTTDGRVLEGRVDEPKGDPGNTLSRDELEQKALRLAEFSGGASEAEMRAAFERIWQIADAPVVGALDHLAVERDGGPLRGRRGLHHARGPGQLRGARREAGVDQRDLLRMDAHHVPLDLLDQAFNEMRRVLAPGCLLYISEPVFGGDYNEILRLFHDEQRVREAAFAATARAVGAGQFALVSQTFFLAPVRYRSFAEFEQKVIGVTHTEHRLSPELLQQVRAKFEAHLGGRGAEFEAPFRVDLLRKI